MRTQNIERTLAAIVFITGLLSCPMIASFQNTLAGIRARMANAVRREGRGVSLEGVQKGVAAARAGRSLAPKVVPRPAVRTSSLQARYPFLPKAPLEGLPSTQSVFRAALTRALAGSSMYAQEKIGQSLSDLSAQARARLDALLNSIKVYGTTAGVMAAAYRALPTAAKYWRYIKK